MKSTASAASQHDQWQEVFDFDRQHLWHPYTSMAAPLPVFGVESAAGVRLKLADGSELIDGMSSWWSIIHDYHPTRLVKALQDQAETLSHVMFGGLTHQPAVELGKRLVEITPPGLETIFFCDSGSVAEFRRSSGQLECLSARGCGSGSEEMDQRARFVGDAS